MVQIKIPIVYMNERIIDIEPSLWKTKKYVATVKDKNNGLVRKIHFGSILNEHYQDSTPMKLYNTLDHNDKQRRINYFKRFSGTPNKEEAINKEKKKSQGYYTAKILSHMYLW